MDTLHILPEAPIFSQGYICHLCVCAELMGVISLMNHGSEAHHIPLKELDDYLNSALFYDSGTVEKAANIGLQKIEVIKLSTYADGPHLDFQVPRAQSSAYSSEPQSEFQVRSISSNTAHGWRSQVGVLPHLNSVLSDSDVNAILGVTGTEPTKTNTEIEVIRKPTVLLPPHDAWPPSMISNPGYGPEQTSQERGLYNQPWPPLGQPLPPSMVNNPGYCPAPASQRRAARNPPLQAQALPPSMIDNNGYQLEEGSHGRAVGGQLLHGRASLAAVPVPSRAISNCQGKTSSVREDSNLAAATWPPSMISNPGYRLEQTSHVRSEGSRSLYRQASMTAPSVPPNIISSYQASISNAREESTLAPAHERLPVLANMSTKFPRALNFPRSECDICYQQGHTTCKLTSFGNKCQSCQRWNLDCFVHHIPVATLWRSYDVQYSVEAESFRRAEDMMANFGNSEADGGQ